MAEAAGRVGAAWAGGVVVASALGLGIASYLTNLHLQLFYGAGVADSLCDLGAGFNCSAVNAAPESEIFGIPQSVLAAPVYLVAIGLGVLGAMYKDARYSLALAGMGLLAVLYSGWLAYLSATVIGAWCLFCIALYVINLSLFGLGLWGGGAGAIGRMASLPLKAPGIVFGAVFVGALTLGGSYAGYDKVRVGLATAAADAVIAKPMTPLPAANADASTAQEKDVRIQAAKQDVVAPATAPSIGPKDAKVTIVELSDFQCPFCKRLSGTLRQITEEYPKDVRMVYVHFPMHLDCNKAPLKKSMHPEACSAAAAAVCAQDQGKFWEMHDRLFDEQGALGDKLYDEAAKDLGLDVAKFDTCRADPKTTERIGKDSELGAALGVSGTPNFFVNGRQLSGAQPIEVLRAVVDAELKGQKELLALKVAVGTEMTGAVDGSKTQVDVAGVKIDAFEASLEGSKAVSKAGVEAAHGVSWFEARDACEAAGKRLCTEQEWLAACTGQAPVDADKDGIYSNDTILGRKYGYADARRDGVCADSRDAGAPGALTTGNHPRCGTPEGAYDMVGGVKEWIGLSANSAAVKGGSYSSGESARCGYYRDDLAPEQKDPATGFRCCEGPAPEVKASVPGRDVGEKLDSFEVAGLDGVIKSHVLAGHPAILTFWASWCGPCQKEMPALASLYEANKDKGLQVLAISVDTDESKLSAWLEAHPMPFLIGKDPGGKLMDTFPNRALPTTFWIKRDGTIRLRTTGLPPGGEKRIGELVTELVGG